MIWPSLTCGARRFARSSWLVAGSAAITISAPATASASSVVARARRAFPPRPSAARAIVGSAASGPRVCRERLQRRTLWPASARSAAVANPPWLPPRIAMFIGSRRGGTSRDGSRRVQLRDFHVRVLEHPRQDLLGVLAEPRRRRHFQAHRSIHLDRGPERRDLPVARMVHLHDHAALADLGIRQHAVDAEDRGRRHVGALKTLDPVP